MNQKLIITLLCGNQYHCWEIGHGKQEKRQVVNVCVVNGVEGAELMTFLEGIRFKLPWGTG